ncbi:rhomboid family intramembrane serine protease [soil metagenome]
MKPEEKSILSSFVPPLIFVGLLWLVKGIEMYFHIELHHFGIFPRDLSSLKGILTMPFIHDDFKHLFSNTLPLVVMGAMLIYFYRAISTKVFLWIWLLHTVWLWIGGRPAWHIGASGIVYGLASFLLFSGVLRKDIRLMALSMLVIFLYGGMIWGMFPIFYGMSWEAHLFGAMSGFLLAWVYREEGPQRKVYDWESEPEEEFTQPFSQISSTSDLTPFTEIKINKEEESSEGKLE